MAAAGETTSNQSAAGSATASAVALEMAHGSQGAGRVTFPAFALQAHKEHASGRLGLKIGDMLRLEGVWIPGEANRGGTIEPFDVDQHKYINPNSYNRKTQWHAFNTRTNKSGWVRARTVQLAHEGGGGGNSRYSTSVNLTEKHVQKLREQFNQMDLDGSGTLAANELHMGLVGAGHKVTMKQCKALVAAVDHDEDQTVDFDEFCEIVRLRMEAARHKKRRVWDRAATKIQRTFRRWQWSRTVPPIVVGPALITWANVWKEQGENTPPVLLEQAMQSQERLREEQWKEMERRELERKQAQERRQAEQAAAELAVHRGIVAKESTADILGAVVDRMVLEMAHEALKQEPPPPEIRVSVKRAGATNPGGDDAGESEGSGEAKRQQPTGRAATKKRDFSEKNRSALVKVLKNSSLLSAEDKRIAMEEAAKIKSQQDRSFFLLALIRPCRLGERTGRLEASIEMSGFSDDEEYGEHEREKYVAVVNEWGKLKGMNKSTAIEALEACTSHAVAGQLLQAVIAGASPYKLLAIANISESKSSAMQLEEEVDETKDYGDADSPVPKRLIESLREALKDRKDCKLGYAQHAAASYAAKGVTTTLQGTQLALSIIMDFEAEDIRQTAFTPKHKNVWKPEERKALVRFIKSDCGLSARQIPAAVRVIERSKFKTDTWQLFIPHLPRVLSKKAQNAAAAASSASSVASGSVDPSSSASASDRSAAISAAQSNEVLDREQKHAIKLAIGKAKSMADIVLILASAIRGESAAEILAALGAASDTSRLLESQKDLILSALKGSHLISNATSKQVAIETISCKECA